MSPRKRKCRSSYGCCAVLTSASLNDRLRLDDVGRTPHEGERDPVDAQRRTGVQIGAVLLRHRGQRKHDIERVAQQLARIE